MPRVAELFRAAASAHHDAPAIIDGDRSQTFTFGQLGDLVDVVAAGCIALDLKRGDRVAILQRNSPYWVACEAAFAQLGLTVIPLNVYLSSHELNWLIGDSKAQAVFFDSEQETKVRYALDAMPGQFTAVWVPATGGTPPEWATTLDRISAVGACAGSPTQRPCTVGPSDIHRIMYTSGTTGHPKAVPCTHAVVVGATTTALANQLQGLRGNDRLLVSTPLTHVANGFLWPFLASGLPSILMARFSPQRFCELVVEHEATYAIMAPTLIADLVEHLETTPADTTALRNSSLRAVWYAGSPIPAPLAARAEHLLGPILNQQYGLTEMLGAFPAMGITQLRAEHHAAKTGSCGRPILGAVVRVLDDHHDELPPGEIGEVSILMPSVTREDSNASDRYVDDAGWLRTGDIGYFDPDGFLYLIDRKADMIVSGGLNVYPSEIEKVLVAHPSVRQCAVVGVPHQRWIEVPHAFVSLRPGVSTTADELIAHCRSHLAHYKAPQQITFMEQLPVNATGKILRRKLRGIVNETVSTP
jgi:acyl-CoA synthetase (AMP-forming)/AMP-acid ligase II